MPNTRHGAHAAASLRKTALDKDLAKVVRLEEAVATTARHTVKLGLGLLFLIFVVLYASLEAGELENAAIVIAAAVIGGYMALNIGANDVANNVGPAVGSRAVTLAGALLIAIVFESAGAVIAGGDVVSTISKGIIKASLLPGAQSFVLAMMAALFAAALWVRPLQPGTCWASSDPIALNASRERDFHNSSRSSSNPPSAPIRLPRLLSQRQGIPQGTLPSAAVRAVSDSTPPLACQNRRNRSSEAGRIYVPRRRDNRMEPEFCFWRFQFGVSSFPQEGCHQV